MVQSSKTQNSFFVLCYVGQLVLPQEEIKILMTLDIAHVNYVILPTCDEIIREND
jgi:hypothetical protein